MKVLIISGKKTVQIKKELNNKFKSSSVELDGVESLDDVEQYQLSGGSFDIAIILKPGFTPLNNNESIKNYIGRNLDVLANNINSSGLNKSRIVILGSNLDESYDIVESTLNFRSNPSFIGKDIELLVCNSESDTKPIKLALLINFITRDKIWLESNCKIVSREDLIKSRTATLNENNHNKYVEPLEIVADVIGNDNKCIAEILDETTTEKQMDESQPDGENVDYDLENTEESQLEFENSSEIEYEEFNSECQNDTDTNNENEIADELEDMLNDIDNDLDGFNFEDLQQEISEPDELIMPDDNDEEYFGFEDYTETSEFDNSDSIGFEETNNNNNSSFGFNFEESNDEDFGFEESNDEDFGFEESNDEDFGFEESNDNNDSRSNIEKQEDSSNMSSLNSSDIDSKFNFRTESVDTETSLKKEFKQEESDFLEFAKKFENESYGLDDSIDESINSEEYTDTNSTAYNDSEEYHEKDEYIQDDIASEIKEDAYEFEDKDLSESLEGTVEDTLNENSTILNNEELFKEKVEDDNIISDKQIISESIDKIDDTKKEAVLKKCDDIQESEKVKNAKSKKLGILKRGIEKEDSLESRKGLAGKIKSRDNNINSNSKTQNYRDIDNKNSKTKKELDKSIENIKTVMCAYKSRSGVMVISGGDNSGKTFLASNIGSLICKMEFRVLLVDLDTIGRGLSYINESAFRCTNMPARVCYDGTKTVLRSQGNLTAIGKYIKVISPGLHILSTSLASDNNGLESMTNINIGKFIKSVQSRYDLIIFDTPFKLLYSNCEELVEISDYLVLTEELSNKGLMNFIIDMANIDSDDDDIVDLIFDKSKIVFNKNTGIKNIFGHNVDNIEQLMKLMDNTVKEITGSNIVLGMHDMVDNVAGIINYDKLVEESWFSKKYYSELSLEKEKIILNILNSIIF